MAAVIPAPCPHRPVSELDDDCLLRRFAEGKREALDELFPP